MLETSTSPQQPPQQCEPRVYRNSSDLVAHHFALPGMYPGANFKAEGTHCPEIAHAHRTARAGPSKVAKNPSPAVSISRPRNCCSSRRTASWWLSSIRANRSPTRAGSLGGPDNVSNRRSPARGPSAPRGAPVRNSSTCHRSGRCRSPTGYGRCPALDQLRVGNALGHVAAAPFPPSVIHAMKHQRGNADAGRTSRTSISVFMRISLAAAAGLRSSAATRPPLRKPHLRQARASEPRCRPTRPIIVRSRR